MKKLTILIAALFCIVVVAPASAIDSDYDQAGYHQAGYYETFVIQAEQYMKEKGMFVSSGDGKHTAIVPKASKSQDVEQPTLKGGDVTNISK